MMLGRQMTPMYRYFLALDPLGYSSYGLSAQDAQFVGRADNAVSYLGHVGPFELNALYSLGYDAVTYNRLRFVAHIRRQKYLKLADTAFVAGFLQFPKQRCRRIQYGRAATTYSSR
ncbi:putative porin [Paraburkholderia sp. WSM4175]